MKKILLFVLIILLIQDSLLAQDSLYALGNIHDWEWELQTYEKDPDAQAVTLHDIGELDLEESGRFIKFIYTRKRRIKILKEGGVDYGEMSYVTNKIDSKVKSLKAFVYNKEGDEVVTRELKEESVFEEEINAYYVRKKFVLPDVRVGSIVEYEVKVDIPLSARMPEWKFQSDIPVIHSEFRATLIKDMFHHIVKHGFNSYDEQDSVEIDIWKGYESNNSEFVNRTGYLFNKELYTHYYIQKHVPAFEPEAFMTSEEDHIMKMELRLSEKPEYTQEFMDIIINRWSTLNNRMLMYSSFGGYLDEIWPYAKKTLKSELDLEGLTEEQKAKKIIEYVRKTYVWNENFSDQADRTAKEFNKTRTGNSAAINLFMTSLLRAADIEAFPVVLSTRDNGKVDYQYPYLYYFNHTIVLVPAADRSFLADGTAQLLPYDKVPPYCINGKGMIISTEKGGLVNLDNNSVSADNLLARVSIDLDEELANVQITIQGNRYAAWQYKRKWKNDEESIRNDMEDRGYMDVEKIRTFNYDKSTRPYIVAFAGNYQIESIGGRLILRPFLDFISEKNPLDRDTRLFPIDFNYNRRYSFKSQISIPEGYQLSSIPEDITIDDETVKMSLVYKLSGNQLIIDAGYMFKHIIYPAEAYKKIKAYFKIITEKFNKELVFEPK